LIHRRVKTAVTRSSLRPPKRRAAATAWRTLLHTERQISLLDCSTMSRALRQKRISVFADASIVPAGSNTPALALPVPTSTPMKCSALAILQVDAVGQGGTVWNRACLRLGEAGTARNPGWEVDKLSGRVVCSRRLVVSLLSQPEEHVGWFARSGGSVARMSRNIM
jgi:hypothetical protein